MTDLELLYTSEEDFKFIKALGLVEVFDMAAEHLAECFNRENVTKIIHHMVERMSREMLEELINRLAKILEERNSK